MLSNSCSKKERVVKIIIHGTIHPDFIRILIRIHFLLLSWEHDHLSSPSEPLGTVAKRLFIIIILPFCITHVPFYGRYVSPLNRWIDCSCTLLRKSFRDRLSLRRRERRLPFQPKLCDVIKKCTSRWIMGEPTLSSRIQKTPQLTKERSANTFITLITGSKKVQDLDACWSTHFPSEVNLAKSSTKAMASWLQSRGAKIDKQLWIIESGIILV